MLSKEFLALLLMSAGIFGGIAATLVSQRARDLVFLGIIILAPLTQNYDVNFVSRDWYRGTVRGFEFSLVDILSISLLVSSVLLPRQGQKRLYWMPGFSWLLLLLVYAAFNVAVSSPRLWGLFELSKMMRGLVIFAAVALYLRSEREMRLLILAWALMVFYQGFLAIEQRYRFGIHRVFGTLDEANSLSMFFCTTAPVLIAAINSSVPKWLKLLCAAGVAAACVGEVMTISRTGAVTFALVLAGAAAATISYKLTLKKAAIGMIVLAGTSAIVAKSWNTLASRFAESTLAREYGNNRVMGRGYYIRVATTIAHSQPFGVGLNNWSYWVSNKYGPRLGYRFVPYKGTDKIPSEIVPPTSNVDVAQAAPAHSLAALTLGELGYPGLVLLLLMWLRWFQMSISFLWKRTPDPMKRIGVGVFFGLLGMFLQSITEWVFRQTPLYYLAHIMAAALASMYYIKRAEIRAARQVTVERESAFEAVPAPRPAFGQAAI